MGSERPKKNNGEASMGRACHTKHASDIYQMRSDIWGKWAVSYGKYGQRGGMKKTREAMIRVSREKIQPVTYRENGL